MREESSADPDGGTDLDPFAGLPDPAVVYGTVDGVPTVRATNDAFDRSFGDPIAPGDPVAELPGEDVLDATGDAPVTVETGDGRAFAARSTGDTEGVVVYADVTDLHRELDRVRVQRDRLDEFAGTLAHDLRNPLEVASARTELARELGGDEHLVKVEGALDRMEEVLSRLLELAREGAVVGETERVSLAECARTAWETVSTADATLTVDGDATVAADPGRLRELLENLFHNAVTHGGDDVAVRVGPVADDGEAVGFYVADDGPGIGPEERPDVFKPGFTTDDDGTGFGLTVVDRVAAGHGWEVTVDESAAGGARFDVTDPAGTAVDGDSSPVNSG